MAEAIKALESGIQFDFAPMEGVTTWPLRNAHAAVFGGIHAYYTPFLAANQTKSFMKKEVRDVDPANNAVPLIPQILTNKADQFFWAVREMEERGYREVNLNLGCPMATVFTKKRGAGFLSVPDELDAFFEAFFDMMLRENCGVFISVKTRLGVEDAAETKRLINIFNRYPLDGLIIHARLRKDFYSGKPDWDTFAEAASLCRHPVCYNGDIASPSDMAVFHERFPDISSVMIGRGLLRDPALVRKIRGGEGASKEELFAYHKLVYDGYLKDMDGSIHVIPRMKELWTYLGDRFLGADKVLKKIRKASSFAAYEAAVEELACFDIV